MMRMGKFLLRWGLALTILNAGLVGMGSVVGRLPRGDEILYTKRDEKFNNLYLMDVERDIHLNLTPSLNAGQGVWSPNGEQIAFVVLADNKTALYLMNANGDNIRRLTASDFPNIHRDIVWSPDGQKIALTAWVGATWPLFIIDVSTGAAVRLTARPSMIAQPNWLADGQRIAYLDYGDRGNMGEVYVAHIDGTDETLIDIEPAMVADWSSDGRRIVTTEWDTSPMLRIYTFTPTDIDTQLFTQANLEMGGPVWSPNGSQIAFLGDTPDEKHGIYVISADGSDIRQLTSSSHFTNQLVWNPYGTRLLFYRNLGDLTQRLGEIYIINTDGTHEKRLTWNTGSESYASWRPRED